MALYFLEVHQGAPRWRVFCANVSGLLSEHNLNLLLRGVSILSTCFPVSCLDACTLSSQARLLHADVPSNNRGASSGDQKVRIFLFSIFFQPHLVYNLQEMPFSPSCSFGPLQQGDQGGHCPFSLEGGRCQADPKQLS